MTNGAMLQWPLIAEYSLNVRNNNDGCLSAHCEECCCVLLFSDCVILARHRDKEVRKIIETQAIRRNGETCVNAARLSTCLIERRPFVKERYDNSASGGAVACVPENKLFNLAHRGVCVSLLSLSSGAKMLSQIIS